MTRSAALFSTFVLSVLAGAPAAVADTSAVILFDGSGSMWGRMEGDKRSKVDAAREALKLGLGSVRSEARLGLATFGARRKGDCSDVEIVVPPAAQSTAKIASLVDKWNPKGKGPLAAALREAAKALPADVPASVIAVVDGVDNCQQDACQAANDLLKSHPSLKIHVVGLSLEKDDPTKLMCVAKPSGGRFFDARDGAALEAAIDETIKLANLDQSGPTVPSSGAGPVAIPSPSGPPGLKLRATLSATPDGPPVVVAWRITKPGIDKAIFEGAAPDVDLDAEPGTYSIALRIGTISAEEKVEVTTMGRTVVALALDAGTLHLKNRVDPYDGGVSPAIFTVAAGNATADRAADPVWIGRAGDSGLVLPAGTYSVKAERGQAAKSGTVTIKAGSEQVFDGDLSSGRLELAVAAADNGEAQKGAVFIVERDDPDAPEGRREIARSAAINPDFTLVSGTYYVSAKLGGASVRERIAVGAGDVVKHTLVLPVGRVTVEAALNKAAVPPDVRLEYYVIRTDGEPREIERSFGRGPVVDLAQGKYRFEVRLGHENVRASEDIVIDGSGPKKIVLNLEAAELVVTERGEPLGVGATPARLEVRDKSGARIWLPTGARGRTLLAPGRYTLRTESADGSSEQVIDLKAGERRTVDFSRP